MPDILEIALARQPIFNRNDRLVGYELLYRSRASDERAIAPDGGGAVQMSSDTISGTFLALGVQRVTGNTSAFVNVDRTMLLDGSALVLDPRAVVIEVLETTGYDEQVVEACRILVERGYSLALDDFVYEPGYEPLLRLASIVKLDVLGKSATDLRAAVDQLRPFNVKCLAERVETAAMRSDCVALGFDLFQGYFFARPEILSGRDMSLDYTQLVRLLNLLGDQQSSDCDVEALFRGELRLTYRLLRMVNSAGLGQSRVTSIGHAIRLLGRSMLHRWMSLLLVSSLATRSGGARDALVELAMIRARFSELLAEASGRRRDGGALFIAGLFSLLDALLQIPMAELVERVNLMPELKQALSTREGPFAPVLCLVECYESGKWSDLSDAANSVGVPLNGIPELYVQAVEWARAMIGQTTAI